MITRRYRLAAALAALTLGSATTASAATPAASSCSSCDHRTVTLTLSEHAWQIRLHRGDHLLLDLRTDSDGGYSWAFTPRPDGGPMRLIDRRRAPYPHRPGAVGYPEHTYLTLAADRRGTETLQLVERQPWNKTSIARRFKVTVTVVPPLPSR